MAPQHLTVQPTAAVPSTATANAKVNATSATTAEAANVDAATTSMIAIKNALWQEEDVHTPFEHPELLSVFPDTKYPPIPVLPYDDRALHADPTFKNLLANATVTHLGAKIGTEISGVQLHELTDAQRDELALLIAQRGVVFFRDQAINIDQQLELGRYWGPLHTHTYLGHPEGLPEVVVVENTVEKSAALLANQLYAPANEWHSDVSYERQVSKCLTTDNLLCCCE